MSFWTRLILLYRAFRDPRAPLRTKVLPVLAVLYGIFPLDLLPDVIPLLGQTDDIAAIAVLLWMAYKAIPQSLKDEFLKRPTTPASKKDVIDV